MIFDNSVVITFWATL